MLRDILIQLAGIDPRLMRGDPGAVIEELERMVLSLEELLEYREMYDNDSMSVRFHAATALLNELRQEDAESRGHFREAYECTKGRLRALMSLAALRPVLLRHGPEPVIAA